jgi:hypothetical protein
VLALPLINSLLIFFIIVIIIIFFFYIFVILLSIKKKRESGTDQKNQMGMSSMAINFFLIQNLWDKSNGTTIQRRLLFSQITPMISGLSICF